MHEYSITCIALFCMKENINENLIRKKSIGSKAKDTIFGVIQ